MGGFRVARGVVRYKHVGPIAPKTMEEEIVPLIREFQADAS
jgi:hypothetical protein